MADGSDAMLALLARTQADFAGQAARSEAPETQAGEVVPERLEVLRDLQYTVGAEPVAAQERLLAEALEVPEFRDVLRRPDQRRATPDAIGVDALYELLSDLLSLDGGPDARRAFSRRPEPGELSPWSRLVKARLRRLGLLIDPVPMQPWGRDDDTALAYLAMLIRGDEDTPGPERRDLWQVAHEVPGAQAAEWIGISGDAALMLDMLRSSPKWRDRWFVARNGGDSQLAGQDWDRLSIEPDGSFHPPRLWRIRPRNPRALDPEAQLKDMGNGLGIRLIKIRLWQLGYYDGDLTGTHFGTGTRQLFISLGDADELPDAHGHLEHFLAGLGETVFAINPHWLHFRMIRSIDAAREAGAEVPDTALYETLAANRITRQDADALRAETAALRASQQDKQPPRIFRTPLRMMRLAYHAVRRRLSRLGRRISELTAPLRNLLLAPVAGFRRLAERLHSALRQFTHFVIGQPVGVGQLDKGRISAISARFCLDRDAEVIALGATEHRAALLPAYRAHLTALSDSLALGLRLGVTVIAVVTAPHLGFLALVKLAFQLLGILRDAVAARTGQPLVRRAG